MLPLHVEGIDQCFNCLIRGGGRMTLGYFTDREHWQMLMRRAMACDFSWTRSVEKYEAVYRKALGK